MHVGHCLSSIFSLFRISGPAAALRRSMGAIGFPHAMAGQLCVPRPPGMSWRPMGRFTAGRTPSARRWRGRRRGNLLGCENCSEVASPTRRRSLGAAGGRQTEHGAFTPNMTTLDDRVSRRRTFAVLSHPDAGKTTLTEKLLLFGGAIQLAGAVKARGDARRARSDWMKIERERGI